MLRHHFNTYSQSSSPGGPGFLLWNLCMHQQHRVARATDRHRWFVSVSYAQTESTVMFDHGAWLEHQRTARVGAGGVHQVLRQAAHAIALSAMSQVSARRTLAGDARALLSVWTGINCAGRRRHTRSLDLHREGHRTHVDLGGFGDAKSIVSAAYTDPLDGTP